MQDSEGGQHNFVKVYFSSPTWCGVCTQFIWGVTSKQGYKCTECSGTAHGKCCVHAKPCIGKKAKKGGGGGGGKEKKEKEGGGKEKDKAGKAGKAAKGAASKFKKMERKEFKITDIQCFDDFFAKAQDPLDTMVELGGKVAEAYDGLSGLFEAEDAIAAGVTPGDMQALFAHYIKEIKKIDGGDFKIEIDDDFKPVLEIKGKHAGRVEDFVAALQGMIEVVISFVTTCPDLISQVADFAQECADFPSKVQAEAVGLNPLKIPGAVKKTADNVKYLGGVPKEFTEVFGNVKEFVKLLKDVADATA